MGQDAAVDRRPPELNSGLVVLSPVGGAHLVADAGAVEAAAETIGVLPADEPHVADREIVQSVLGDGRIVRLQCTAPDDLLEMAWVGVDEAHVCEG